MRSPLLATAPALVLVLLLLRRVWSDQTRIPSTAKCGMRAPCGGFLASHRRSQGKDARGKGKTAQDAVEVKIVEKTVVDSGPKVIAHLQDDGPKILARLQHMDSIVLQLETNGWVLEGRSVCWRDLRRRLEGERRLPSQRCGHGSSSRARSCGRLSMRRLHAGPAAAWMGALGTTKSRVCHRSENALSF